jgi:hypothetical protein
VSQPFDTSTKAVDGSAGGCDRLGVAIFHHQRFGLGGAFGATGTDTQVHSVALATAATGPGKVIAALNVLNAKDCSTMTASGNNASIYVQATLNRDGTNAPGTIAVESGPVLTGPNKGNCNQNDRIIVANGSGAHICANSTTVGTTIGCDGGGFIYSHAKDTTAGDPYAFDPGDVSALRLRPQPIKEGGAHGYTPVTSLYGCNTTRLTLCAPAAGVTNYIARLEATFGAASPVPYDGSQAPYSNYFTGTFQDATAWGACGTVSSATPVVLPAAGTVVAGVGTSTGNWYCPGGIDIKKGILRIVEGNLVLNGDLTIENTACLIVNTSAGACTAANVTGGGTPYATTIPAPTRDSIVYLKGGNLEAQSGSSFLMPQTFVYAFGASKGVINVNAPTFALWTAPGAGALDNSSPKRTPLEATCWEAAKAAANEDCLNSRFAKLAFWSDYKTDNTGPNKNTFQGGGSGTSLFVVGVVFTPTSTFNLGGQSSLPLVSQFWSDKLTVGGGASLPLQPTDAVSIPITIGSVGLIR